MENQLAADIKSGEDAENRDQSELVEPDINYLGVNGYVRLLVGCLNYLLGTTLRTYPCILVSSTHLSWHVLVFWKHGWNTDSCRSCSPDFLPNDDSLAQISK